jgi:hypothetical protein
MRARRRELVHVSLSKPCALAGLCSAFDIHTREARWPFVCSRNRKSSDGLELQKGVGARVDSALGYPPALPLFNVLDEGKNANGQKGPLLQRRRGRTTLRKRWQGADRLCLQ